MNKKDYQCKVRRAHQVNVAQITQSESGSRSNLFALLAKKFFILHS